MPSGATVWKSSRAQSCVLLNYVAHWRKGSNGTAEPPVPLLFQVDIRYPSVTEARGPRQAVQSLNENCKWKRTNQSSRTVPHYCALSASSLRLKSCEDLFLSSHVAVTHTHTHQSMEHQRLGSRENRRKKNKLCCQLGNSVARRGDFPASP